jgi:hypothetical protein
MKRLLIAILLLVPFLSFSQEKKVEIISKIYLKNGEEYVGKVVAISDAFILMQSEPNIVSIKREDVLYFFSEPMELTHVDANQPELSEPRIQAMPMSKNWMSEIETGITFISPFFFRMGYKEWYRLNSKWHAGLGTSLQFFRYSMLNANVSIRKIGSKNTFVKSFLEAEYGVSYYENITNVNGQGFDINYPFHFSPVHQGSFGYGLWMDTSLGVVITTKLTYSATGFNLEERYNANYLSTTKYFISTMAFSTSFIF